MHIVVTDIQAVAEYEDTLYTLSAQGINDTIVSMTNEGTNTINYRFQEYTGTAWNDIGLSGSALYNTLISDQSRTITVASKYSQIRCVGNASGGSILHFSIQRSHNRASGGAIPIVGF